MYFQKPTPEGLSRKCALSTAKYGEGSDIRLRFGNALLVVLLEVQTNTE